LGDIYTDIPPVATPLLASSTFGLVTISGCAPPYAAVDVRRPSFSGRRLALEFGTVWFATPRHVCTVTACFLQSSEDLSLQTQFSLTILLCPRSDTCHYGHISRSYLLTRFSSVTHPNPKSHPNLLDMLRIFRHVGFLFSRKTIAWCGPSDQRLRC